MWVERRFQFTIRGLMIFTAVVACGTAYPPVLVLGLLVGAGFLAALLAVPVFLVISRLAGPGSPPSGEGAVWDRELDSEFFGPRAVSPRPLDPDRERTRPVPPEARPRMPHVRKIGQLMIVVAAVALILTPFAWSNPESRWPLFVMSLTVVTMLLIVSSSFLVDRLGGSHASLRPRTKDKKPLPPLLRLFTWQPPPHRRDTPQL
jgi:hypothetical protein